MERLRLALAGRRRGGLTEAGRAAYTENGKRRWSKPGEREFFGEIMREIWATPEHQAKIAKTNAQRRSDPQALEAMRARLNANRLTSKQLRAAISAAWWRRHASEAFPSNNALDDWIVAQYIEGMSARQIAIVLGMAHNTVAHRLKARGVAMPHRGMGRRTPALSARHLAKKGIGDLIVFDGAVAALYAEGNSAHSIAKGYGLSDEAIRTSLHRSGIPLRGKGGKPSKIPAFGYRLRAP